MVGHSPCSGCVVNLRPMRSRKGDRWAILTLHDMTGMAEVLAFPAVFAQMEATFKSGSPLIVRGRVNVEEVGTRLVVIDARPIEQSAAALPAELRVRMPLGAVDDRLLDRLDKLLGERPGSCPVIFELVGEDGAAVTLEADRRVKADRELATKVRELCGAEVSGPVN